MLLGWPLAGCCWLDSAAAAWPHRSPLLSTGVVVWAGRLVECDDVRDTHAPYVCDTPCAGWPPAGRCLPIEIAASRATKCVVCGKGSVGLLRRVCMLASLDRWRRPGRQPAGGTSGPSIDRSMDACPGAGVCDINGERGRERIYGRVLITRLRSRSSRCRQRRTRSSHLHAHC